MTNQPEALKARIACIDLKAFRVGDHVIVPAENVIVTVDTHQVFIFRYVPLKGGMNRAYLLLVTMDGFHLNDIGFGMMDSKPSPALKFHPILAADAIARGYLPIVSVDQTIKQTSFIE